MELGERATVRARRGLEPKPADFTNCKVMAKDSDDVLLKIIKGGGQSVGRSTVMPALTDFTEGTHPIITKVPTQFQVVPKDF